MFRTKNYVLCVKHCFISVLLISATGGGGWPKGDYSHLGRGLKGVRVGDFVNNIACSSDLEENSVDYFYKYNESRFLHLEIR